MKNKRRKILSIIVVMMSILFINTNTYAHSGRTDAYGGHKDNKNKSGLGGYHYHCGGYPAHLHKNGICPYSSSSSSNSSKSSTSETKITTPKPSIISVSEIKINENVQNIEVGKSKKITATILPSNATDKNIVWKSSNDNIATVDASGVITAKKIGTVDITAISSNGKTSTLKINIKEEPKTQKTTTTNTIATINNTSNNTTNNIEQDSNLLGGILSVALLGGGSYWGYNKFKKSKK